MSGRAAFALALANVAVGLLNYLFQVHGAAVLDTGSFGLLSAWLAQVTLIGTVGTVVQFVSLDTVLDDALFARLLRTLGLASLVALVALVALGQGASRVLLGATTVLGSVVLSAILGQLQARLRLGDVAVAVLVGSAVRFLLPFLGPHEARAPAFFVAHASAAFAACVMAGLLVMLRPARPAVAGEAAKVAKGAPTVARSLRFGRPALLAFANVLFPLLDVLVISALHDDVTTGAFSRVALAARIVFFGGAAVLQISLPHQLHAARTRQALPRFVVLIQRWLTRFMVLGAVALAAVLDHVLLRARGEERVWLFATCIGSALLVAVLDHVHRFAAQNRLRVAAACVAGVVVASAAGAFATRFAGSASVTWYAVAATSGYAMVVLMALVNQRDSRAGPPGVGSGA